nr:flavodoxin family protein [Maliibacterium massiliense]
MNVVAINGSPRARGNTYQGICVVAEELERAGVAVDILQVGAAQTRGCVACGKCRQDDAGCALGDAQFHAWVDAMCQADGLLLASPVYYAGMTGAMKSFLDRAFYSRSGAYRMKVGGAFSVARRAGNLETTAQLEHYMQISEMLIAPTVYWSLAFGAAPGEVLQDDEGMRILRTLGRNMAYLLRMQQESGVKPPAPLAPARTNFIRERRV